MYHFKSCLGVSGKQVWVSPKVSSRPGHRDTAVKEPLCVSCRESPRRHLFTFLLTAKTLFTRVVGVGLLICTLNASDIKAVVEKPVGCSCLAASGRAELVCSGPPVTSWHTCAHAPVCVCVHTARLSESPPPQACVCQCPSKTSRRPIWLPRSVQSVGCYQKHTQGSPEARPLLGHPLRDGVCFKR